MTRLLLLLCALLLVPIASAQNPDRGGRAAERIAVAADDVRELGRDVPVKRTADRLKAVADLLDGAVAELVRNDARDSQDLLDEASELLDEAISDLRDAGYDGRADRAKRIQRRIMAERVYSPRRPMREQAARERDDSDGIMEEGRYVDGKRVDNRRDRRDERGRSDEEVEEADSWDEHWNHNWNWNWGSKRDRDEWRANRSRFRSYAPAFVGDFGDRWPFVESGTYRPIPSIRYNRVDGLAIGIRQSPLDWDSYDRARVYGQVGYAFGLDAWRYEVGGEARLGHPYSYNDFDLKVGGAYRRETATNDLWKASWAENSTAAFLFKTDFFDYFQTEGYTLYAVGRLTPLLQTTVAYRSDDYSSLSRNVHWSLFGGDDFRFNPGVRAGRMQSVVVALDGGQIRGLRWIPSGVAFRAEAEFGDGLGGDFAFNRYLGDIRAYMRPGRDTGVSLRLRGGTTTGQVPLQKTFTLGGAGSLRAYPQNIFRGTSMVLANAEVTLYDVSLFDDLLSDLAVFGIADAGWVDGPSKAAFDTADLITSAGFGVGLSDRQVRLELAWPLRDLGTGMEPTLWLRLNPTF